MFNIEHDTFKKFWSVSSDALNKTFGNSVKEELDNFIRLVIDSNKAGFLSPFRIKQIFGIEEAYFAKAVENLGGTACIVDQSVKKGEISIVGVVFGSYEAAMEGMQELDVLAKQIAKDMQGSVSKIVTGEPNYLKN